MPTSVERVELLGGLPDGEGLARCARFRPLDGALEERLAEIAAHRGTPPERVSAIVAASVEAIGERRIDRDAARELCVADRRQLVVALARQLGGDDLWLHPVCDACGAVFDVHVARSALPVKPAGRTFPFADASVRGERVRLRVPNGGDQERIAALDPDDARRDLLARCIERVADREPDPGFVEALDEADVATIDAALDEAAPDLGTVLSVACAECGNHQLVHVDPYRLDLDARRLYREVHDLAWSYHWSESDILALPRGRRRYYLSLIERERGLYG